LELELFWLICVLYLTVACKFLDVVMPCRLFEFFLFLCVFFVSLCPCVFGFFLSVCGSVYVCVCLWVMCVGGFVCVCRSGCVRVSI
jgi:hypothetical protein